MKDKNKEFEESGVFLDVMSKKERKRWKKEQEKLRKKKELETQNEENDIAENIDENENEKVVTDVNSDEEKENTDDETNEKNDEIQEMEPIGETISSEDLEKEQEKNKEMLEFTEEIPSKNIKTNEKKRKKEQDNIENKDEQIEELEIEDDDYEKVFNPTPLLGFILVLAISFFIYIILFTDYNNSNYLIINSSILILITLFLGITALCNKNKISVIFYILLILGYIIFNIMSITNYDKYFEKIEDDNNSTEEKQEELPNDNDDKEESEVVLNEYSCSNSDENLIIEIKESNNHIIYIKRTETFNDEDLVEEIVKYYEDIDGITIDTEKETLILEFDFSILDVNQYKVALETYNNSLRLETNFSYIDDDKLLYDKYIDTELKDLTCKTKER